MTQQPEWRESVTNIQAHVNEHDRAIMDVKVNLEHMRGWQALQDERIETVKAELAGIRDGQRSTNKRIDALIWATLTVAVSSVGGLLLLVVSLLRKEVA